MKAKKEKKACRVSIINHLQIYLKVLSKVYSDSGPREFFFLSQVGALAFFYGRNMVKLCGCCKSTDKMVDGDKD